MNCRAALKLMPLAHDGRLPERQALALQGHLRQCDSCRAEQDSLEGALGLLRELPPLRPPVEFQRAVLNAVRQAAYEAERGRLERSRIWLPRLAYAGVAIVLAMGAVYLLRTERIAGKAPSLAATPTTAPPVVAAMPPGAEPEEPAAAEPSELGAPAASVAASAHIPRALPQRPRLTLADQAAAPLPPSVRFAALPLSPPEGPPQTAPDSALVLPAEPTPPSPPRRSEGNASAMLVSAATATAVQGVVDSVLSQKQTAANLVLSVLGPSDFEMISAPSPTNGGVQVQ